MTSDLPVFDPIDKKFLLQNVIKTRTKTINVTEYENDACEVIDTSTYHQEYYYLVYCMTLHDLRIGISGPFVREYNTVRVQSTRCISPVYSIPPQPHNASVLEFPNQFPNTPSGISTLRRQQTPTLTTILSVDSAYRSSL